MPAPGPGPGPRWALTAEAFERLLGLLGPDRDSAARRYEVVRGKLMRLFEWRGFHNAEELADATFDRVARKVDEGAELYASDPYSFLHGVALRIAQEHVRAAARERSVPEVVADASVARDWPLEAGRDEQRGADERRLQCLDECLAALKAEARELLWRYYGGVSPIDDRRGLARALAISATALRLRAFRLRATVQDCVTACCARTAAETERPPAP